MSSGFYNTDRALSEYLLFHYGKPEDLLPYSFGPAGALNFPARCVHECVDLAALPANARGLDLGCAVGRSSFELTRYCQEVIAIDRSASFIRAARHIQETGSIRFSFADEGSLLSDSTIELPSTIDRSRVSFEEGDALELRSDLGLFDIILLANLIDRLNDPRKCLEHLRLRASPKCQLVIVSPYSWSHEYTPPENWLGGFQKDRPIRTREALGEVLSPHFNLRINKDLPFLIREHARKYQWSVAEATVWVRRSA